jgi:Protein of unknown function (DUF3618)
MTTHTNHDTDPEQLRRQIEQTRLALGDTVARLAQKADVKAQAREKVDGLKATVTRKRHDVATTVESKTPDSARSGASQVVASARAHPKPLATAAALAAGFALGRLIARRRG